MKQKLERFPEFYEQSQILMALYDADDRIVVANAAYRRAYDLKSDSHPTWTQMMRANYSRNIGAKIRCDDFEFWLRSAQARRGKTQYRAFEWDLCDGRWLWTIEEKLANDHLLCTASDITPLRVEERDLRLDRDLAKRASHTDELTGAGNRRFVLQALSQLTIDGSGCVAIFDIDYFKLINDRFGHQRGDMVLRDFVTLVHSAIRRSDSFGRIGGEEFMLVLPGADLAKATVVAERVLSLVRRSRPIPEAPHFSYTASVGLAEKHAQENADMLYRRADAGLYASKNGGRDRIALAPQRLDTSAPEPVNTIIKPMKMKTNDLINM